jgi:uncharacterized protein YndB with AHSA1/START domain
MERNMGEAVGQRTLRFERELAHSLERVWAAITETAQLSQWMEAEAVFEPRVGGRFELRWPDGGHAHGEVRELVPLERLVVTWNEVIDGKSLLTIVLESSGAGTRLVLVHEGIGNLPGFGAGWHAHLDVLDGMLDGVTVDLAERFDALQGEYQRVLA